MKCNVCITGGRAHELEEATTSYLGRLGGGNYAIIEEVPCLSCPNCGEEYFEAGVAEALERILMEMAGGAEKVRIASFAA